MVKSPKSGRELDGQRIYKGPPWVARLVRKYMRTVGNFERGSHDDS